MSWVFIEVKNERWGVFASVTTTVSWIGTTNGTNIANVRCVVVVAIVGSNDAIASLLMTWTEMKFVRMVQGQGR